MKEVTIDIESYLFKFEDRVFRATPYFELSIDEWVVYEGEEPKYYIDFNNRTAPIVIDINNQLQAGIEPESIINEYGRLMAKNWTLRHNIVGDEVPGSEQVEPVRLWELRDIGELSSKNSG